MLAALQIAASVWSWIWSHKTLAVLIAVAVALAWSRHELSVVTIERDAAQTKIESYQREARDADDRADVTATTAKQYLSAYNDQKARAEALDAQATQQAKDSAARFADLDRLKAAAETRADAFKTELERKANAPGATAADVGRAALAGLKD